MYEKDPQIYICSVLVLVKAVRCRYISHRAVLCTCSDSIICLSESAVERVMIHINSAGESQRSSDCFSVSDALLGNDGVTEC